MKKKRIYIYIHFHDFKNIYFHDDKFYFYNGIDYRILHISTYKRYGNKYVFAMNPDGKKTSISYSR